MTENEDKRIDDLTGYSAQGFARVEADLRGLREQTDKRFEQVDRRFEQVDRRFEQVDRRFDRLEDRMDRWGLAIFVTMLGLLATALVQGFPG